MLSEYQKGVRGSCVFYGCVILAAVIIHAIEGWDNWMLWPRSSLVIVIGILVSLPWVCVNIINLFAASKRARNLGEAVVHSIMWTITAAFIFISSSVY